MNKQSDRSLIIGHVRLNSNLTLQKKEQLITQNVIETFQKTWMLINNQSYTEQRWNQIFMLIQETKWSQVGYKRQQMPSIPQQLNFPTFRGLICLSLESNHIVNIEGLVFLNCEQIQILQLQNNEISVFKAMNKLRWRTFKEFKFKLNLSNVFDLSRMKTSIMSPSIDFSPSSKTDPLVNDFSSLVKLEWKDLKIIVKGINERRIMQREVDQCLSRKYCVENVVRQHSRMSD